MNLSDWLGRSAEPSTDDQLALVAGLAQAVEDGHRDGKRYAGWSPSRIKVASDNSVDLSGLDAAETKNAEDLAYTAPECADGTSHTARSDVYSAGVILYEILASAHPFGGLGVRQPRGAPKPLRDVRPEISRDLADGVSACLERDPDWRPADLSYVLQVVRELINIPPPAASRPAPAPSRTTPLSTPRPGTGRRNAGPSFGGPRGGSSRKLPVILAGIIVVVASGTTFWLYRQGKLPGQEDSADEGSASTAGPSATATPVETETPAPETTAAPAPASPTPLATARGTPRMVATVAPRPTEVPALVAVATAMPTVVATVEPAAASAPPVMPAVPPTLKTLSPPKIRRGQTTILDLRGQDFHADHKVRLSLKGRDAGPGVRVTRQRVADPGLMQVVLIVEPNAPTGSYALTLVDSQDRASNALPFEIAQ